MPGFTKDQLTAMNADLSQFRWCRKGCKRYWHKRGFASHARACRQKVIIKFTMPKIPKPKKGDVMILNPAWERFMDWLIKGAFERWKEQERDRIASGAPPPVRAPEPAVEKPPKRDYELLTVDEAVTRLGMTREEILAMFEAYRSPEAEQSST